MADVSPIDIPNRALFKSTEVCELLKVQPYVLKSWEAEFPQLGVAKSAGAPRVYRRQDVEQVQRIKHLLLVDGLTLAGARRKIEEEFAPVAADVPEIDELIGANARERLTEVKRGLTSILELLSGHSAPASQRMNGEFALTSSQTRPGSSARSKPPLPPRGKSVPRNASSRPNGRRSR